MTDQGLWVVPVDGENDTFRVCEPREWYCQCGRYVADAPICDHGGELSAGGEFRARYFEYLLMAVETAEDFERECEADHIGRR